MNTDNLIPNHERSPERKAGYTKIGEALVRGF